MTQPTPLMPHATASWLVDSTSLSFEQIAEFCGLHILEVQAMADDLASSKYTGRDPVRAGELTMAEIEKGQADLATKVDTLCTALKVQDAKASLAQVTPIKGASFEDQIHALMNDIAAGLGDDLRYAGGHRCFVGDVHRDRPNPFGGELLKSFGSAGRPTPGPTQMVSGRLTRPSNSVRPYARPRYSSSVRVLLAPKCFASAVPIQR